jgi:hypothetical protein
LLALTGPDEPYQLGVQVELFSDVPLNSSSKVSFQLPGTPVGSRLEGAGGVAVEAEVFVVDAEGVVLEGCEIVPVAIAGRGWAPRGDSTRRKSATTAEITISHMITRYHKKAEPLAG